MNLNGISLGFGAFCLLMPVVLPAPEGLSPDAWRASGLALVMALWWLTEAIPLAATALMPLAFAPLLGVMPLEDVSKHYSHPLIILFLGGFLLAKAIERCGLHRLLAFTLLGFAGTSPKRILAAVMVTTAFLSLWISNTAAAMVIAPVASAIASSQQDHAKFCTALMLGVAFSATIGGIGSLIGTPPNAIFAAYVSTEYGYEIGFSQWAMIGLPISMVLLVVTWAFLAQVSPGFPPVSLKASFGKGQARMSSAQRRVAIVAGLTALAWISRPLFEWVFPGIPITDAGIAMITAVVLFLVPSGDGVKLLDWETAATLRWDVLILLGGGLALAGIVEQTGLADWIGLQIQVFQGLPAWTMVFVFAVLIVYVGELASNTAMAAIFLPVAAASATAFGADPVNFIFPIAIVASVGFMLPVATPPNAIVFSSPHVNRSDMLRAGTPLDLIGILVAVSVSLFLTPHVFSDISVP